MDFRIIPFERVGEIKLGMLRTEVRKTIGSEFVSFKRSPQSTSPCDYFAEVGTFAYYDLSERLEAIEFAPPARPTLNDVELMRLSLADVSEYLATIDNNIEIEVDGLIAHEIGISIYASLAKTDPSAPIDSVTVFQQGYYD